MKIIARFNGKRLGEMAESMLSYAVFRRQYLSEVKRVRRHEHNAAWEGTGNPRWKSIGGTGSGVARNGPPRALKTIVFNVIG